MVASCARVVGDNALDDVVSLMVVDPDRWQRSGELHSCGEDGSSVRRCRLEKADVKDWVYSESGRQVKLVGH